MASRSHHTQKRKASTSPSRICLTINIKKGKTSITYRGRREKREDVKPNEISQVFLQTEEKIPKTDNSSLMKRTCGMKLSTSARKALDSGRIIATLMKDYPDKIMYNHREEFSFHGIRLYRENNMSSLLKTCPEIRQTDPSTIFTDTKPSQLLLSFLISPENWKDIEGHHMEQLVSSDIMKQKSLKTNTRSVDHDTDFPCIERGGEKIGCVIVGCEDEIKDVLHGSLDYGETCDSIIKQVHGGGRETGEVKGTGRKRGYCTANNFPVLVGMEYQKIVKDGRLIDFFKMTSNSSSGGLVPLLLTSCFEAVQRVQLQYIQLLYDMGAIQLELQPVDSSKFLYRLSDTDQASLTMQMKNSKVFLYSVMISCKHCNLQHNELWRPHIESEDPSWLDEYVCEKCGSALKNDSCFVMNGGSSKNRRDPATVRGIHYEISKVKGKYQLPEDVNTKEELPQYEHIRPEVNGKYLQIFLRQDYARKVQKHHSVSITLFVPVCYDEQKTLDGLEKSMGEGKVKMDGTHKVNAFCYLDGKEHKIQLLLNRFKISLSLNKKITLPIRDEAFLPRFFSKMPYVAHTLSFEQNKIHLPVPGTQTNKRIGVQTVDSEGNVCQHSCDILQRSSVRNGGTATDRTVQEVGNMYTAVNYWCIANDSRENNFMKYGATLIAGLINNFYQMGKAVTEHGETVRILEKEQFSWLQLDSIISAMSPGIVEALFKKATHKLQTIDKEIKSLQQQLQERDSLISTLKVKDAEINKNAEEVEQKYKEKCKDYEKLVEEKDSMEREMRAMKRAYKSLEGQMEALENKYDQMDTKFENMFATLREEHQQKSPSYVEGFDVDTLEANLPDDLYFPGNLMIDI